MRLVNLDEFLELPEGTIYQKFSPNVFEEILVKGRSFNDENKDFYFHPFGGDSLTFSLAVDLLQIEGASRTIVTDVTTRNVFYKEAYQFAVWEKEDVQKAMTEVFQKALDNFKE